MGDRVVPKIVKSNLRGVLLSKVDGVLITELLREYKMVTQEMLDFKEMGFTHLVEFLRAVPDVARIVDAPNGFKKVVGIALNDLNITARKSCFKDNSNEGQKFTSIAKTYQKVQDAKIDSNVAYDSEPSHLRGQFHEVKNNKEQKPVSKVCQGVPDAIKDSNVSYDFRASFLKQQCPEYGILRIDPNNSRQEVQDKQPSQLKPPPYNQENDYKHRLPSPQSYQIHFAANNAKTICQMNGFVGSKMPQPIVTNPRINQNGDLVGHHAAVLDPRINQNGDLVGHHAAVLGEIPRSMTFAMLQRMLREVCPEDGQPVRRSFPSCVDIMLTHVEQTNGYFWGIVIKPYDPSYNEVLDLDSRSREFAEHNGEKRAVMHFQNYYCRVWVKSMNRDRASVFMVDFGNSEMVSVHMLRTSPPDTWRCPPLACPFRYVGSKELDIVNHIDERHRCWLSKTDGHIFEVSDISLL